MNKKTKKTSNKALDSLLSLYDEEVPTGSVKFSLYEVLFQLFQCNQVRGKNLKYKKIRFVLSNLIQSLQMIGILLTEQDMENWESYNMVWNLFQYTRVDHLASELGVFFQVSFAIEIFLISLLVYFWLLVFALYNKKMPPDFIFSILRVSLAVSVFVFGIPVQIFLQSFILFPVSKLHNEGWFENIPFSLLALASHIFLNIVLIIGSSEIRHFKDNVASKSCCQLELSTLAVRFVAVAYFVINGSSRMIFLSAIVIAGEIFLILQCVIHKFYYRHFANQVKVFSSSIVFSAGIAVVAGHYSKSAGTCVLILLLVAPSLSIGLLWWMPKSSERKPNEKMLKLLAENPLQFPNFLDVEKVLRPIFLHELSEYKELVLKALGGYFKASRKNRDSHLIVWETNYCFETLKNERLARVKLAKRLISKYSLEGDFHAFVLLHHIVHNGTQYFQEIDYLQFRVKLDDAKETDTRFCKNFLELMEELTEKKPRKNIIHGNVKNLSVSLEKIDCLYNHLCTEYKASREVLDLYQSFLRDITRDQEKANYFEEKYGQLVDHEPDVLEYFNPKTPLMMVSGQYKRLGFITYANDSAIQLLQDPDLVGKSFEEVIPPQFSYKHYRFLKRFLFSCTEAEFRIPKSLFMRTSQQYIIELYLKIKCICLNSYPVFIVTLRPKNKEREVIIFNDKGIITSHTQNIAKILGLKTSLVRGFNIQEYLMNKELRGGRNSSYYFVNGHNVYYGERKLYSTTMRFYKFYKDVSKNNGEFKLNLHTSRTEELNRNINSERQVQIMENFIPYSNAEVEEVIAGKDLKERKLDKTNISDLLDLPVKVIKMLAINMICFILAFAVFTVIQNMYMFYGLNTALFSDSLRTGYDLKHSLLKIANEARLVDLIDFQDSFLKTIIPFQQFRSYNEGMIELLTSCGNDRAIYDKNIGYWEDSELKYANLLDFSDRITANAFDYFTGKEMVKSYKFLVMNSGGVTYEGIRHTLDSVETCISSMREEFGSNIEQVFSIFSLLLLIALAISVLISVKLRNCEIQYWEVLIKHLSESSVTIQNVLLNRLESDLKHENVNEIYKTFHKTRWAKPQIPIYKYIWRSVILGVLIVSYFFSILDYAGPIKLSVNRRIELAVRLGESSAEIQALNFWTREMIYKDSLESMLGDLNPFQDTESEFLHTHRKLNKLLNSFIKRENVELFDGEIQMLFDSYTFDNHYFISGIHGHAKATVLDSRYFAYIDGNADSKYKEFLDLFMKVDSFLSHFIRESFYNTDEFIGDSKITLAIISCGFFLLVLVFSLATFVLFLKDEKNMIWHKQSLLEIITLRNDITR